MKNPIFAILVAIGMIVAGNVLSCKSDTGTTDVVVVTEEPITKECPPVVITADYERKAVIETILSLKGWNQPIEWVIVDEPIQIPYQNKNGSGYIEGFSINGADIPYSKTLLGKTQKILNKFSDHSVSEQKVLIEDLICSEQLRLLDTELEKAKCPEDEPTLAPPVSPDGDDEGSGFSFPWWILWLLSAIALILFLLWLLSRLKRQGWAANESGSDRPNDDEGGGGKSVGILAKSAGTATTNVTAVAEKGNFQKDGKALCLPCLLERKAPSQQKCRMESLKSPSLHSRRCSSGKTFAGKNKTEG